MHDISLHILDLIENSVRAHATLVSVGIEIDRDADVLKVRVEDNGEGIRVPPEQVLNPFYTTHEWKKVGLGLSFFKAAAEMAGGRLTLSGSSALGGVCVDVRMRLSHVDRPPLGNLAETISTMVLMNPSVDFRLSVRCGARNYEFQVSEFAKRENLDGTANVALANSVFETLRPELEVFRHYDLAGPGEKWRVANRAFLRTVPGKLQQGADA